MSENFDAKLFQPPHATSVENEDVAKLRTAQEKDTPVAENQDVTPSDSVSKEVADIQTEDDKYSPEAIRAEIKFKAEKIRSWAGQQGLVEGRDFLIIERLEDAITDPTKMSPHEKKQFAVGILEDHYGKFKEYILGQYTEERKEENPTNKYGGPELGYSWGGRFAVINDGVFFDTVPVSSVEQKTVPTHHEEFKDFFRQRAGFDFPTSEVLNPILQEMSSKGLDIYVQALNKLLDLKIQKTLPDDGYGLIDDMERAVKILRNAQTGEAVSDLPEVIVGEMSLEMRLYADLTYNAEDLKNLGRVTEITGITIPDEVRLDKIFERFNFDRTKMESICRDFSDYITIKRNLAKMKQEKDRR